MTSFAAATAPRKQGMALLTLGVGAVAAVAALNRTDLWASVRVRGANHCAAAVGATSLMPVSLRRKKILPQLITRRSK
jgi:hypothetical protein